MPTRTSCPLSLRTPLPLRLCLHILPALLVCFGSARGWAQTAAAAAPAPTVQDQFLEISTIPLWANGAPGALGTAPEDTPTLTYFPPQHGTANGTAVIIAPGGAYLGLASNLEGRQVADWFAARGIAAFVLRYRLGAKYLYPIPLNDAKRAVRLVRAHAEQYGIRPDRIGFVGFSAGGHLAASVGTLYDNGQPDATDPIDRASSRPDLLVLGYPWLNAMQPNDAGLITYCSVLKIAPDRCPALTQPYTPALHVTAQTPPTFIYHTSDDKTVPVEASVTFYTALHAAGVSAEMHIFATGTHGSGLGRGDAALDMWPRLLEAWLRVQGWLK